ncbi:MAG TPA: alpha/beta fold hydrolase, partial [Planctomycetota bacterium]|nr:alpha/beta fold hydrolase [Planctomycetota bacterium]
VMALRTDDRGCGKSGGDFATASYGRLLDDARAALEALRARPDVEDVVLVGHGEGALMAAQLSAGGALVLLAPPGRTLDAILLEQADDLLRAQGTSDALRPKILEKERALYDRIRAADGDWLDVEERRTFVGWMKERFRLDPTVLLRDAKASRVAILQGSRDEAVPPSHAGLLAQARPGVEVRRFEGLDHVFRRPGAPVDREFLKAVVEAVLGR